MPGNLRVAQAQNKNEVHASLLLHLQPHDDGNRDGCKADIRKHVAACVRSSQPPSTVRVAEDIHTCIHQRKALVNFHRHAGWLEVLIPETGDRFAHGSPFTPRYQCVETDEC